MISESINPEHSTGSMAALSPEIARRLLERRSGKLHLFDSLEPQRTALVVIDMQRAFLEPGAPSETPAARGIVESINRIARALRSAGGTVAFAQATFQREGPDAWPLFFDHMVSPALARTILEALSPGHPLHALWPGLEVQAQDVVCPKKRYSAFFPGACAIPDHLRARGIDTVIITGTLTNVCCEASARDAMMADFRTIMVSDANAARSAAEHRAALDTLAQFFADIRTTEEVLALLRQP
jgi:ureidoacrylate peracid hydrolase